MQRELAGSALTGVLTMSAVLIVGVGASPVATAVRASAQSQNQTVTVEGCVAREQDVPGRRPNIAERAGISEDYILTHTKMIKGTAPGRSGAASQAMYEIEGIDDEQLKAFVGKRVQIDGTFENVDHANAKPERGTPNDDLVEIDGAKIRAVSGSCGKS